MITLTNGKVGWEADIEPPNNAKSIFAYFYPTAGHCDG